MILSDVRRDVKKMCIDSDLSFTQLAEKSGTSKQYVSRLLGNGKGNGKVINSMIVKLVEQLGYDIKIEYVKRGIK